MNVVLIIVALIVGLALGIIFTIAWTGGTKYDGTIGLEQQDDGRWCVAIHYDVDELERTKKPFITLKVLEDRKNPIANNSKLEISKEES